MKRIDLLPLLLGFLTCAWIPASPADTLEKGFQNPPAEARPWVYWFWLNGNITSNGITADLEAMRRVGVGGVLIMEVDQGAPVGPADFMGDRWQKLFGHVASEAHRLGIEVNMNNDAGWNGSGGPWIKPEQAMQEVTWSETNLTGPAHFEGTLAEPEKVAGFYRDIAVQAFPKADYYRLPGFEGKAAFQKRGRETKPAEGNQLTSFISREQVTDLTARMDASGRLLWDVPAGEWTIIRFGHTCTGVENAPAPATGRGLECDKLSREGIAANYSAMMAKLAAQNPVAKGAKGGLVATHIDSWENGSQNWTARMREEFQQRRGYDLLPFLPILTGRTIVSADFSERFLWDLRRTVSELVIEYYAGGMRELAHANGLRFTAEAYGSPCDHIPYGGQSDEPMGEFWTPSGAIETCRGMASSGHVYGKRIIGAEAFTSADQERWKEHPALLKSHGDRAFCEGINRFVFHRYAMQPWTPEYRPGMTMGPWGQHYERTQTWWEWLGPWHEYLARCQYLLRQGHFVADILYLQNEAPPQGFTMYPRRGYDWDECGAEVVLTRLDVQDGRLVLPDGMSYRVLALPNTATMTPALLRRIKGLVEKGATVIGAPPKASPSLTDYPHCDAEVARLAAELWGDCDGVKSRSRAVGQGRIVWAAEPEKVLAEAGVPADFSSGQALRFLHRALPATDLYFVANPSDRPVVTTASFRVQGRVPELWWPDTGRMQVAPVFSEQGGVTTVALDLAASGSVFVVFRKAGAPKAVITQVTRGKESLFSATPEPPAKVLIRRASYGPAEDAALTRDVREQVQRKVDGGETTFAVRSLIEHGDPAPGKVKTLTVDYEIDGKAFTVKGVDDSTIRLTAEALKITVDKARYGVLDDPQRTRDVRAKLQRLVDAGQSAFVVARMADGDDPAFLVVKTLEVEYTRDGQSLTARGTDPELIDLRPPLPPPGARAAAVNRDASGHACVEVFQPGHYQITTAIGRELALRKGRELDVNDLPAAMEVAGPWNVSFAPNAGAPATATFEQLGSWSDRPEPGIKYFSGSATYARMIQVPRSLLAKGQRLHLDLGRVEVMAKVRLNGKDLGLFWKPPFLIDITDAAKAGENHLEVTVVNLWPNRQIGDEFLPEDSERNPDGTLKQWPAWVQEGKPSPSGRVTFTSWRLWKKNDPLLASGLIGPVRLLPAKVLRVD